MLKQEYEDEFGTGPVSKGENPNLLAMAAEGGLAEFEVI